MIKRQLLLEAAAIVEKIPPKEFSMSTLNYCILGYCRRYSGFEKLNHALAWDGDFIAIAARFFGISLREAGYLFGGDRPSKPKDRAADLRRTAGTLPVPTKPKPGTSGVKVLKKAMREALAVPAPKKKVNS